MAEDNKVRCEVIGPAEVLGVAAPGTVEIDPDLYNIEALVYAGHVEVLEPKPAPDAKAKKASATGTAES